MSPLTDIADVKQAAPAESAAVATTAVESPKKTVSTGSGDAEDTQKKDSTLIQWLHKEKKLALHEVGGYRKSAIIATPAAIVNNSPNVIGALQLTAELAMFKSNGSNLLSPDSKGNPLRYVIDPPINVYRSVTGRAKSSVSIRDFAKPEFYSDSIKNFRNLTAASKRDLEIGPLVNRWQARATFAGIVGWGLNFITPNAKETPEQIEANVKLSVEHPVAYVFECFRKAIVFPLLTVKQVAQKILPGLSPSADANDQLGAYKRQFSGLGMMVAGACSFLGGWRNVAVSKVGGKEFYYHNWQYCATGLITFLSSLPLLFSPDNDKGYSQFGAIHLMRCFFLPGSILKKFNSGDKGASWYVAGHGMLQSKNGFAALVGGATKNVLPDGTVQIIDHTDLLDQAKKEAKQRKFDSRSHKDSVQTDSAAAPSTTISQTASVEKAMPERAAEAASAKDAATVTA